MKIYQVATCPFAHRARIVLNEKKLPYEIVYFEARARPEELGAVSPDARSPTIFDEANDTWVWDSLVVCEYLEERYPDAPLMPKDPSARARSRLLMREVDAKLGPIGAPIVEQFVHNTSGPHDGAKIEAALARLHAALVPWDARLEGHDFLLGDQFTLADVALYTPLVSMAGLLGPDRPIPATRTHLLAWRDRIDARPSAAH